MNLAKTLKKKRDAEERLRKRSPSPTFVSGGGPSGGDIFVTEQTIVNQINNLSFADLPDTPASYTGQEGKVLAVKSTEDGLEFVQAGISFDLYFDGGSASSNDFTITFDGGVA